VILGGLVTTTIVSLFVLPALYLHFGGRQPTLSPEEELMHRWVGIEPDGAETVSSGGAVVAQAKDGGESGEPQRA